MVSERLSSGDEDDGVGGGASEKDVDVTIAKGTSRWREITEGGGAYLLISMIIKQGWAARTARMSGRRRGRAQGK